MKDPIEHLRTSEPEEPDAPQPKASKRKDGFNQIARLARGKVEERAVRKQVESPAWMQKPLRPLGRAR
jgi:hypothetical protein